MEQKSKESIAGKEFGCTLFTILGGLLVSLLLGFGYCFTQINRAFDRYWMKEKGTVPEGYMYVILWAVLFLAPILVVKIMKLLLPDQLLEVIDTFLGIIVTMALLAAAIIGASKCRK